MQKFSISLLYSSTETHYKLFKWGYLTLLFSLFTIISFFVIPVSDASLYFHETVHILETLKSFQWIGNEPVGTHGILFKLIPALLLGLFGINPIALSLYHVILSFLSVLLFEKFLSHFFHEKIMILSGIILFSASYFFVSSSVTYTREIPVLFSSLLLFYSIVKGKSKWIIGLLLLLILDAKEHVFFQIAPGILIYQIYTDLIIENNLKKFIFNNVCLWIFPFLYIFLMMFTSIIPVNSFVISILPLSEVGTRWVKSGFAYGAFPKHPDLYINPFKGVFLLEQLFDFRQMLIGTYFAKPFLPRVIGFQSMPMPVVFPAVVKSISLIGNSYRRKAQNHETICLSFIFISYLLIYFLRASHGRYLLSITPILILMFLIFLKEYDSKKKLIFFIIIGLVIWGLFFEISYIAPKAIFYLITLVLLYLALFKLKQSVFLFSLFLAMIMGTASLGAMYLLEGGALNRYFEYGKFENTDYVFENIDITGNIYTNTDSIGNIRSFLRVKVPNYFYAHKFKTKEIFPKSKLSKTYYVEPNVFPVEFEDSNSFLEDIEEKKIKNLIVYTSPGNGSKFKYEKELIDFVQSNKGKGYSLVWVKEFNNVRVYNYKYIQ